MSDNPFHSYEDYLDSIALGTYIECCLVGGQVLRGRLIARPVQQTLLLRDVTWTIKGIAIRYRAIAAVDEWPEGRVELVYPWVKVKGEAGL